MGRTLEFTFARDTRFSDNPKQDVEQWANEIKQKVDALPTVHIKLFETKKIHFPADDLEGACDSYRKKVHIWKDNRRVTWNDVYKLVNSVKPCHYSFV